MIKDREYVCASASLFASDALLTPKERLGRYMDAQSPEALRATVKELFRISSDTDGDIYSRVLEKAVSSIRNAVPDFSVFAPLLLKYDCTNIKTAIKASVRDIDCRDMLFECGTIPCEKIIKMAENSSFDELPAAMAKACRDALRSYNETKDAFSIDLLIDGACFEDMHSLAKKEENPLIERIVSIRADGANIMSALRISALNLPEEAKLSILKRAFVSGGTFAIDALISKDNTIAASEEIATKAAQSRNALTIRSALSKEGFAEKEKTFDEAALSLCGEFRYKPFGPEVAVRYLLIREGEMMNCRIIESALARNLSAESIKERLRVAYV